MSTFVLQTKNIKESLQLASKNLSLAVNDIDFDILNMETKIIDIENKEEIILSAEESNDLYISQVFEKRKIKIEQVYEVSFFKKGREDIFDISLSASKDLCSLYLIFKKDIVYFEGFKDLLFEEIKKKKLRAGILINLFEKKEWYGDFEGQLRVRERKDFKSEKFLIAESFKPSQVINDRLEKLYLKKEIVLEKDRIDYKKRDFIKEIKENEVIIEYIKPKNGSIGLSFQGNFISETVASIKHVPIFKIGESIKIEESPEKISYISLKSGFINFSNTLLEIKNSLEITELSLKKSGNIELDLSSNVDIFVTEKNLLKDAIQNVEVDVKNIVVEGSIGPGAIVVAETVEVKEQVHQNAKITAREIRVNKLKGSLNGDTIHVHLLEQGKIKGKKIYIEKAQGGMIIGEEVFIDELKSNTTIIASKIIHIKTITGEDNSFVINPFAIASKVNYDEQQKRIFSLEGDVIKANKKLRDLMSNYSLNKDKFLEIRERKKELKEKKISLPAHLDLFLKKYELLITEIKSTKLYIEEKEFLIHQLRGNIRKAFSSVEEGKVSVEHGWFGFNKILFKIGPGKDILLKTKKEDNFKLVSVIPEDEDKYKLRTI